MWEVDSFLDRGSAYEQIGADQWRASINGLVTASAVAATPFHCFMNLKRAVDFVLSRMLMGSGPFTYHKDGATASLAPQWEKLLTAEIAMVAVSATPKAPAKLTEPKLARKRR